MKIMGTNATKVTAGDTMTLDLISFRVLSALSSILLIILNMFSLLSLESVLSACLIMNSSITFKRIVAAQI